MFPATPTGTMMGKYTWLMTCPVTENLSNGPSINTSFVINKIYGYLGYISFN